MWTKATIGATSCLVVAGAGENKSRPMVFFTQKDAGGGTLNNIDGTLPDGFLTAVLLSIEVKQYN